MAGVPEVEVPSVQPEAAPVVPVQGPSPGAFGGLVIGEGLSKIGEALFDEGHRSYLLAAEAMAQEKENDFQKGAFKIASKYETLYNLDAVKAHQKASIDLDILRAEIGSTIQSKHGLSIYSNNSLRNSRLAQELIDHHFERQNKSYQLTQLSRVRTSTRRPW